MAKNQSKTGNSTATSAAANVSVLPIWSMIGMGILLTFTASAVLAPQDNQPPNAPVFVSFRSHGTDKSFVSLHYNKAPILYGILHTLPAVVWCICMPLQHVQSVRKRYPTVHRWSGRIAVSLSALLSLTGILLTLKKCLYTQSFSHVHRLRMGNSFTILAWPSAEPWAFLVGPWSILTAVQTYVYARKRDFIKHKRWADRNTLLGYIVPLERVCMLPFILIGAILPYVSKQGQHTWLNIPYTYEGRVNAEKAGFSLSLWAATAIMLVRMYNKNLLFSS